MSRKKYVRIWGSTFLGFGVLSTVVAGCTSDDSSGGNASDAATETSSDVTSGTDVQTSPDVSAQDSPAVDSPTTSDAQSGGGEAGDGQATDGTASEGAATDAMSEGGDATTDGGVCVTTIASLGRSADAGEGGAAPTVLFDFDASTADAGLDPNFSNSTYPTANATGTLSLTSADGHPCDGALKLAVTFTACGPHDDIYYNYGSGSSAKNWTGYTKLHAWLKVVTTDYSDIQGVEPRVDSNGYASQLFGGFVSGATLADGAWHESVSILAPGSDYVPAAINGFQFEFQTTSCGPDGGVPPSATLLIDSIWIE
jgi:hypothetical protein